MWFQCEDGRNVNAGLAHETTYAACPKTGLPVPVRKTVMWLKAEGNAQFPELDLMESAECSQHDQFCRKTGRQLVRARFMPMLEDAVLISYIDETMRKNRPRVITTTREQPAISYFTREDRKKIYAALLPEYHPHFRFKPVTKAPEPEAVKEIAVISPPSDNGRSRLPRPRYRMAGESVPKSNVMIGG